MIWILPLLNLVSVLIALGLLGYWQYVNYSLWRTAKLMPLVPFADGYLPIFGHTLTILALCKTTSDLWDKFRIYCDYYKEGCLFSFGHQVWLILPDIDIIQEVLTSQEAVEKSYMYSKLNTITDGVFIAPTAKWRKLRKRLNLTFSGKHLDSYMDPVNEHTEIFLNVVLKKLQQMKTYVDIQPYIARYFFDVMTKTHFAADTDEQVHDRFKVAEKASRVIEMLVEQRMLQPHMHVDFIFQFTQLYKDIVEIREKPFELVNAMVENRLKLLGEGGGKTGKDGDFLIYVDLVAEALKELNIPVNVWNVQTSSNDLLIAGSDTTSVTAATLLYHLALNKDIQEKVYEEVSKVYGNEPFRPLTRQELASLTYLEKTINEALRWSLPPGIIRELRNDLEVDKYVIPKNTNIYIMVNYQHSNPKYYEKHNDFYPEHFCTEAVQTRHKMAFLPFSSGPRNCPGKVFAYVLLKSAVATIINNYEIETDLALEDVKRKMVLMTQHVQGYPIRLIPRIKA